MLRRPMSDTGFNTGYESPIVISLADLLGNDTDADGDSLTVTGVRNATNGTVIMNDGVPPLRRRMGLAGRPASPTIYRTAEAAWTAQW